jgi:peptidyl-prolyl cis-trans isomerase A (cyclophilin A)
MRRRIKSWSMHTLSALAGILFSLSAGAQNLDAGAASPRVRFVTTLGSFTVELDAARAPLSTANMLQYVREGHYHGTIFHRVVGNFVVQGGGHLPDGSEKPVRNPVPNESGNGLSNRRGTVAMARTGDAHSATSQFYVNLTDNLALDPSPSRWGYAVIGRVVEGMEIIDKIASVPTGASGPFPEDAPLQPIVIQTASALDAGDTAAAFAPVPAPASAPTPAPVQ